MERFINKIMCGDCIEVMKDIPDKSIDLVLTDPPYGIGKAEWDFIDFEELLEKVVIEFKRILKDGSLGFIWFPKKFIYRLSKVKFEFDIFIETKNFAQKRKSDIGIDYWVPILIIRNGKYERKNNREGFKNWFMINSANTGKNEDNPRIINHPSVKDVKICKYIIEKTTKETDLILDPFLGSGTTAVAAYQLKRNYIGIEISEKYCKIAEERLRQKMLF